MKKFLTTLFCISLLALACSLSACQRHPHTFGEWETVTEATCAEVGEEKHSCTMCGYTETRPTEKAPHTYAENFTYNETEHWYAATCEHSEGRKGVISHTFSNWENIVAATCGDPGEEKRTCVCGYFETRQTDKIDHPSSKVWTYNTTHHWHDSSCGHQAQFDFAPHIFGEWQETKAATCGAEGEEKRTCVCGYFETRQTDKVAHPFSNDWSYNTTHHWYDSSCGHQAQSGFTPHSFGNWKETKAATCSAEGEETRTCICGYSETRPTQKIDHTFATTYTYNKTEHWYAATCEHSSEKKGVTSHTFGNWQKTKAATCSAEGEETRTCICGYSETRSLQKTDHPFATTYTYNKTEHWYAATCEHSSEKKGVTSHTFGDWQETKAPTCDAEGEETRTCVCGCFEKRSIAKKPHTYSNKLSYNKTEHWYAATCKHSGEKKDITPHTFGEWQTIKFANPGVSGEERRYCECGYYELRETEPLPGSAGLNYALNGNGQSYTVTGIGSCTNTNIMIPATYNGKAVTAIGDRAFIGCTRLTSVTIGDIVTTIGERAFFSCSRLTSVKIPNNVTTIGSEAFYGCDNLTSIKIPNSVTKIGNSTFNGCDNLTSVTIGNSVTTIGNYAFYGCNKLTSIIIGNSVTSIGSNAFCNCTSLTSVTIPDGITRIGNYAFYGCNKLTSITIGNSVTSIGDDAFYDCYRLADVYYKSTKEKWNKIGLGSSNNSLTDATLYYYSETQPTTVGNYWHYVDGVPTAWEYKPGSQGLEYTQNSDGTYAVTGIGTCSDANIVIPTTYNGKAVTAIGFGAFWYCDTLISIDIPNSVTRIGNYAFYNCDNLKSIIIGNGVTKIESLALYNCYNVLGIYYKGTAAEWNEIVFGSSNTELINTPRYYYSKTRPTTSGNYWHYDEYGNIAIW